MNKQSGFGTIGTIIILAIVAAAGWLAFTKITNLRESESASEAIDRAQVNVEKANEASNKANEIIQSID